MTSADAITSYADLDELLIELLGHWQRILGDNLVGAYLQGSFALGGGDQHDTEAWRRLGAHEVTVRATAIGSSRRITD